VQKISPFLWFDGKAEEAAEFYISVFPNSKIGDILRNGPDGPGPQGSVLTVAFELDGQEFTALNGGPHYKFSPATSFVVNCETQDEVDYYWEKLSAGGKTMQCGWLDDKYGVTWQVVPSVLVKMLQDKDAEKSQRVMKAMMQMDKMDIAALKRAYEGK